MATPFRGNNAAASLAERANIKIGGIMASAGAGESSQNTSPRLPPGMPLTRVIAMPSDANPNGDRFGGLRISQKDLAGASLAAAAAGAHVMVAHLDAQLRAQRLPLAGTRSAPAARAAGRVAGKPGRLDQRLELPRKRLAIEVVQGRGKPDVIELALVVVEAEQQRPDQARVPLVAEPADHAICRAPFLDLEHGALARLVNAVDAFGDPPVERAAARLQPT